MAENLLQKLSNKTLTTKVLSHKFSHIGIILLFAIESIWFAIENKTWFTNLEILASSIKLKNPIIYHISSLHHYQNLQIQSWKSNNDPSSKPGSPILLYLLLGYSFGIATATQKLVKEKSKVLAQKTTAKTDQYCNTVAEKILFIKTNQTKTSKTYHFSKKMLKSLLHSVGSLLSKYTNL